MLHVKVKNNLYSMCNGELSGKLNYAKIIILRKETMTHNTTKCCAQKKYNTSEW